MTIIVDTTQKAVLRLDKDSTVLDLVQALTENLGGEWDDAKLSPDPRTGQPGGWGIVVTLENNNAPARASTWESEDGMHVAPQNPDGTRSCSCGFAACTGVNDDVMAGHFESQVGCKWREDSPR